MITQARAQWRTLEARTGETVALLDAGEHVDVVFTDIQLGGARRVGREVRASATLSQDPVIYTSGAIRATPRLPSRKAPHSKTVCAGAILMPAARRCTGHKGNQTRPDHSHFPQETPSRQSKQGCLSSREASPPLLPRSADCNPDRRPRLEVSATIRTNLAGTGSCGRFTIAHGRGS
jgi:hypothetical protein